MSSLPQNNARTSDKRVKSFFNNYYSKQLSFPSNQVDAVIGFFENRGFEKSAAINVATVLLQQAKIDNINIFQLLDTLKGLDNLQLSAITTEILNYSRSKNSTLGYKRRQQIDKFEKRNIVDNVIKEIISTYIEIGYVDQGYVE